MRFWLAIAIVFAVSTASCDAPAPTPLKPPTAVQPVATLAPAVQVAAEQRAAELATQPVLAATHGPAATEPAAASHPPGATTLPALAVLTDAVSIAPTTQPGGDLGPPFVDLVKGIEFNPPAGGTIRRTLNSGETVGYAYPDRQWDLRVKPVPLPDTMPLSPGLLQLTGKQLVENNGSTVIVRQSVFQFQNGLGVKPVPAGLIEARYKAGIDLIFAQEILVPYSGFDYLMVQMIAPGGTDAAGLAKEAEARRVFREVLSTLRLTDREELRKDQVARILNTEALLKTWDQPRVEKALVPVHYLRLLRFGKDIGFVQMNERPVAVDGVHGIQVAVRSYMELPVAPTTAPSADPAAADQGTRIQMPDTAAPAPDAPAPDVPASSGAAKLTTKKINSSSRFFVSFDRRHENRTTAMVVHDGSPVLAEEGNSDVVTTRILDTEKLKKDAPFRKPGDEPPMIFDDWRTVSVTPARGKVPDKKFRDFFYLPQALAQILPRLMPTEPKKYAFASYVTDERQVMFRYVDVDRPEEVVLGGVDQKAIPIRDRIGVEGVPTTHYVTAAGQWLGSLNEQTKLEALPISRNDLQSLWPQIIVGWPEPPMPDQVPAGPKKTAPPPRKPLIQGELPDGR